MPKKQLLQRSPGSMSLLSGGEAGSHGVHLDGRVDVARGSASSLLILQFPQ